jgi:anti-anti-sigma regulatory factor
VRLTGVTETARGFGPHDHLCWVYDEPREYHCRAMEFLADGLAQGQQVWYIADISARALWDELRELDRENANRRRDSVHIEPLDARCATGAAVDPISQVRTAAMMMRDALAAGFTGIRVVTESTLHLRTPEQVNAWACCELLADRYMMTLPFSALCAYNRAELSKETIAHVACLHPTVNGGAAPFRLYSSCGAAASLSGELDLTSCDLFATALQRADLRPVDGELIIDATELDFIDHRNLLVLAAHARSCAATAVLRTGFTNSAARMVEILDVTDVRVEVSV